MAESDSDDLLKDSWCLSKRKLLKSGGDISKPLTVDRQEDKLTERTKKFEELKAKSSDIFLRSSLRRQKTEVRRSQKLLKKALKDPWIKAAVDGAETSVNSQSKEDDGWEDVKPFLSVNQHLQGPIPHGDCGPKTELEYQIEDCIQEADFEKAELLSDALANRQFAVKIAHAFAAKEYQEKQDELKAAEGRRKKKKFRGMFDAKEKWQMKGNM